MNYLEDVRIDQSGLDVEWLNQPALAMQYGKHWAKCQKAVTRAEEAVKLKRSQLIKRANSDPEKELGAGVKITAPNIESYYRTHKEHVEAKEVLIEAQYECNIAEIAKKEIGYTRKNALENLVRLHAQSYFAGPNTPRDLDKEVFKTQVQKEKQKEANSGVSAKMKRNKKK